MIRIKNVKIINLTGNPVPIPYPKTRPDLVGELIFDSQSYRRLFIPADGEILIKITGYSNMDEDKGLFTITKSKQSSLYFKCNPEHSYLNTEVSIDKPDQIIETIKYLYGIKKENDIIIVSPDIAVILFQLKLPFLMLVPDEETAERDKNGQILFFRNFISIKEG